jgi:hypothetical protein
MKRNTVIGLSVGGGLLGLLCCAGTVLALVLPSPDTEAVLAPVETTVTPSAVATPSASPTASPKPKVPIIEDGVWTVGTDIPAGKYRVTANLGADDTCYWAITKTGSNGSDIIANDLPQGGRPQVTLKKGQDFATERCGIWSKIG